MSHFTYQDGVLHAERVPLSKIAVEHGTPTYVYSKAQLLENFAGYARPCANRDALVCYAMKANSNLAILDLLAQQGAGFDIVSGGELLRVIAAGGDPGKVILLGFG
jgi:diaminopimelate decarboxylase